MVLDIIQRERIGPVRDLGLLMSAIERPHTTVFGKDAYPSLETKAAALIHSVCLNHALSDGNKRLSAILGLMFLDINGRETSLTNDELFDLIMKVADGSLRDVDEIAQRLATVSRDDAAPRDSAGRQDK